MVAKGNSPERAQLLFILNLVSCDCAGTAYVHAAGWVKFYEFSLGDLRQVLMWSIW